MTWLKIIPTLSDRDGTIKEKFLYFGSVTSLIYTSETGLVDPDDKPEMNLPMSRSVTLVDNDITSQLIIVSAARMKRPAFLPNPSITDPALMHPITIDSGVTEAENVKYYVIKTLGYEHCKHVGYIYTNNKEESLFFFLIVVKKSKN